MATGHIFQKLVEEVRTGLLSSVAAEALLFPLDSVKLRQQINGGTAVQVVKRILHEKGARGLYQGLIGRLIQTVTSNVGFFIWQTLIGQLMLRRLSEAGSSQLGTGMSLIVNMVAQQVNRLITNPVDVVANVNQANPNSRGFFHTFVELARTGGRPALWRGLTVSLLLSLNPALMFTCVGKLSAILSAFRGIQGPLSACDMFWVSGFSKAIATLLTYPLIRAKAVISVGGGAVEGKGPLASLWIMLHRVAQDEGIGGLYKGVWMLSYKTVLFNSLMMSFKQKLTGVFQGMAANKRPVKRRWSSWALADEWQKKVVLINSAEKPWKVAAQKGSVVYVDGSWSYLHEAQDHFLREAAKRGDYLVVGVHKDECVHKAVGSWPSECFAARVARLRAHSKVTCILEDAPWSVCPELIHQLGISKVLSGSMTKMRDCSKPCIEVPAVIDHVEGARADDSETNETETTASSGNDSDVDTDLVNNPYAICKQMGIYEEIPSLNTMTENDVWLKLATRVFFSNVDGSIDWRILASEEAERPWKENPGYA